MLIGVLVRWAKGLACCAFVIACDREPRPSAEVRGAAKQLDLMPCGDRRCDAKTSYCEIYLSDVPEPPTDYECKPLPHACLPNPARPPSCQCFPPDTPCSSFCGPLPTDGLPGFHLTCQGKRKPRAKATSTGSAQNGAPK